jgi:methionyl-tRNA formyltransferase
MKAKIIFMGTSEFAVPSIRSLHEAVGISLLVTQPDKPAGRNLKLRLSPAKEAALELGIEIYQPERIKSAEALDRISSLQPQILWVAAYGQILPQSLLEVPELGAVNLHGSLLPAYRGAAPIQRAIMNGDSATGATILYMTAKVDTGDILLQRPELIYADDTSLTLGRRLSEIGAELVLESTAVILEGRGRALAVPQDESKATYAPIITKAEAEIDWSFSAERIRNLIRAMIPWPTSFTYRNGERLRICRAEVKPVSGGRTGEVVEISEQGILLATGQDGLLITELQPENRKCLHAAQYINGYKPACGEIWGKPAKE